MGSPRRRSTPAGSTARRAGPAPARGWRPCMPRAGWHSVSRSCTSRSSVPASPDDWWRGPRSRGSRRSCRRSAVAPGSRERPNTGSTQVTRSPRGSSSAEMSGPRHEVGNVGHVAVIGGGIVGLCVAHYLRAAGVDVVVLERDRVGSGASRGNAGEICPGLATPLAAPGVVGEALRGLRHGGRPLQLRPQANPAVARFLLGFAWSARQAPFSRGVRALAQLGADAVSLYRELDADGVEMHRNDRPYLYVYGSRDAAAAGRQSLQRALGEPSDLFGPVLDAEELRRREPCLAGDGGG